jgi:Fe-S-cluster containining protein
MPRRISLPLFDAEKPVDLPPLGGKGGLVALLPALRKISVAMMTESEARSRALGKRVSCKPGCTACCHQLVPVTVVEAKALATALARLPAKVSKAIRTRFAQVLAEMESAGLLQPRSQDSGDRPRTALVSSVTDGGVSERWDDVSRRYFELDLACPFLVDGRCAAYDERPFVCREYTVTSPKELCSTLSPDVEPLPRPAYPTEAMAATVDRLEEVHPAILPLPLLLEWVAAEGDTLRTDHDLLAALETLVREIVWDREPPPS